jgi:hypothetical protein
MNTSQVPELDNFNSSPATSVTLSIFTVFMLLDVGIAVKVPVNRVPATPAELNLDSNVVLSKASVLDSTMLTVPKEIATPLEVFAGTTNKLAVIFGTV